MARRMSRADKVYEVIGNRIGCGLAGDVYKLVVAGWLLSEALERFGFRFTDLATA